MRYAVLTALAACSSPEEAGPTDGGPVSDASSWIDAGGCYDRGDGEAVVSGAFARSMAAAFCCHAARCCAAESLPFEVDRCRTNLEARLGASVSFLLTSPGITYDGVQARACVDAYERIAQTCGAQGDDRAPVCMDAFRGTIAVGEPCPADEMTCVTRRCGPSPSGARVCTDAPTFNTPGRLGDLCAGTCTRYEWQRAGTCDGSPATPGGGCYTNDGLFCSSSGVCAALPPLGEPCEANSPCEAGAYCENGACVAQRTSGPCNHLAVRNDQCAASAYCNPAKQQCEPRRKRGEPCSGDLECPFGDRCAGTCRPRTVANRASCEGQPF